MGKNIYFQKVFCHVGYRLINDSSTFTHSDLRADFEKYLIALNRPYHYDGSWHYLTIKTI